MYQDTKKRQTCTGQEFVLLMNYSWAITFIVITIAILNENQVSISKIKLNGCSHSGIRNEESWRFNMDT